MAYDDAMEKYGSDKPDLRFGLEWKRSGLPYGAGDKLNVLHEIKLLRVPGFASASRSQLDKLQELVRETPGLWFSYLKRGDADVQSPLAKAVGAAMVQEIANGAGACPGDLVLLLGVKTQDGNARSRQHLDEVSGRIRLDLAGKLDLIKSGKWTFLWVVDFPMFDYDERENRFVSMHHPFTSPVEEYLREPFLEMAASSIKAQAYDVVLNGVEVGGGSFRIHRGDIQQKVFKLLGLTEEQARERFGFFLEALEYGTPPHGGIALGHDRIIALMAGEASIREVIAFPKTASAVDLMCESPAGVDAEQLDELGLSIKKDVS
jgi:aspartyl-tRNA synthetase